MNMYWIAAAWIGLALLASLISIRLGISVALVELVVGAIVGNIPGSAEIVQQTEFTNFLATVGSLVLTFLAGAEIDPDSLRRNWKPSLSLGVVSFAAPFLGAMFFARLVLAWSWPASEIAGVALSTTSVRMIRCPGPPRRPGGGGAARVFVADGHETCVAGPQALGEVGLQQLIALLRAAIHAAHVGPGGRWNRCFTRGGIRWPCRLRVQSVTSRRPLERQAVLVRLCAETKFRPGISTLGAKDIRRFGWNRQLRRKRIWKDVSMKAVVYHGPRDVRVGDVPDAEIERPTDALVRITSTNICGSDLHMYEGRTDFEPGRTLRHESMGEVVEVGTGRPTWGAEAKKIDRELFSHSMAVAMVLHDMPQHENRVDLDPEAVDAWGLPVARITLTPHENDLTQGRFLVDRCGEILEAAGAKTADKVYATGHGNCSHQHGTARMGDDPDARPQSGAARTKWITSMWSTVAYADSDRRQPDPDHDGQRWRVADHILTVGADRQAIAMSDTHPASRDERVRSLKK